MKKKTKPVRRNKSVNPPAVVKRSKSELIPVFLAHRHIPDMICELTRLWRNEIDRIAITNGDRIFHFETEQSYQINRDAPAVVDGSCIGSGEDSK